MTTFIKKYKNAILNVLLISAPIAVGFYEGHVFTPATIMAFVAGLIGKLAASPLDHSTTIEDAIATATQINKQLAAVGK